MPEDEQNLPAEIAATLAPHFRHALDSPTRRRILRVLNATTDAQTLEDLGELIPAADINALTYHVLVLEQAGCISEFSQVVRANGTSRAYASNITDNQTAMDVLRATQRDDELDD